ncbi:unnamed protein product [Linum trigynum]|uniref:Uncharacterized protein n=1 Tax=Linum trigynum TaxID=586398 RepID=A0AAV2DEZ1_9ROSI
MLPSQYSLSSFGARCWGAGSFDSPPSSLKPAGGINRLTFGARIRRRMKPRQRDGRLLRVMETATLSRTTRRRRVSEDRRARVTAALPDEEIVVIVKCGDWGLCGTTP